MFVLWIGFTPGDLAANNGDTPVDVIFILDQTDSISQTELEGQLDFVNDFASNVPFGGNNYRIGVFSWNAAGVIVEIQLNDFVLPTSLSDFQVAVNNIVLSTSASIDIQPAIMRMREHFREGFGARSYAAHVGILLADEGLDPNYIPEIALARDEDIILFAVGLQDSPAMDLQEFIDNVADGITARGQNALPNNLVSAGIADVFIGEIQRCSECTCENAVYVHSITFDMP